MGYIVCQTPKCQQTYPMKNYEATATDIPCSKCGGILIDENGRANCTQNSTVIPVMDNRTIENSETTSRMAKDFRNISTNIKSLSHIVNCKTLNPESTQVQLVIQSIDYNIEKLTKLKSEVHALYTE